MHHICESCMRDGALCGRLIPVTIIPRSKCGGLKWLCKECRDEIILRVVLCSMVV